jgi:hypothetical protein
MIRRRALFLAPLLLALRPRPAFTEEAGPKQVGQYVDLQPVALPIVVDGRLLNYVFVTVRLNLAANADTPRWRAQEPFFRDALVRSGYATPFTIPGDYAKLDAGKLTAALMRDAEAIAGPGVVRSVAILRQTASRSPRAPRP